MILCTIACQAPLPTGFSRQEYWSGLPHLCPRDLPNPGFKPTRDAVLLIQNHTWRPQIGVSQLPRYWYCGSDNSLLWGAVLNIVGYCSILDLYSLDADSSALEFCAKLLRSCPTLCDLMDCSLPGPSVHGFLQARILEWVATPFSKGSS